ncbi:DUF429 domain-containing protein [Zeimonas arvi]|uniref:DUF429 domain-containing protein n=1 Tax=Zeimonas arvi TaxID=2498847 RepID=A0A5C8NTU4_9BURK|nr:DUF429 domain-containing protein [Zeimonas arvi]TXL64324.1 DUF429 domain-containing protein [Zeimonas arvi]
MRLHGIDFSSAPTRRKPIVVASGRLAAGAAAPGAAAGGASLDLLAFEALESLAAFDEWLRRAGPWLAAFDFPFGWPRELIESLGWPAGNWAASIDHAAGLSRAELMACLRAFCQARAPGSKFAHRATDRPAGSSPSMKWVNPPVALMLHAGAPRLLAAGATLPGLHAGDPARIALEAYPGFVARSIVGRESYKSDDRSRQTPQRREARARVLAALASGENRLAIAVRLDPALAQACLDDATGDRLDALLCLAQAAWAWQRRDQAYGLPARVDPLEGWIVSVPADGETG